ncbi:glycosyltransferase family 2 protein [[Clostridium] scindens]|uniref:glycosyltransferase family 2 protein n=1 Tax=Clostridium scindens (strain JCM 10418 / VPI 12708) TaxID=29347 RepID=UPI001AA0B723|nr:glycosyltransferase family 2 protein [[Clostridium] scindens]MBO1681315.1 glycosyltransferase family 2 protein [[Clostridium] scindens]
MGCKYYIDKKKYRIKPIEKYIRINGWCFDKNGLNITYEAEVNGKKVTCNVRSIVRKDVQMKYQKYKIDDKNGFQVKVFMENNVEPKNFRLFACSGNEKKVIVSLNKHQLDSIKDESTISYHIDTITIDKRKIFISGWATSVYGLDKVKYSVIDSSQRTPENYRIVLSSRKDVVEHGLTGENNINCGFIISFDYSDNETYLFSISDGKKGKKCTLIPEKIRRHNQMLAKVGFARQFFKAVNVKNVKKGMGYIRKNGISGLREYVISRVNSMGKPYKEWFEEHRATADELEKQRNTNFLNNHKISIIVPTFRTPIPFLREMIDSVVEQSYQNWELCIADGSEGDLAVEEELKKYVAKDSRIKYKILKKNLGIAGNTNEALTLVTGDYIGLFDHDDILAPNALFEVASALQERDYDIIYTDEDKITGDGKEHSDPNFKPDFSMDLFCSHNYITHFFVVKTEIMNKIGGFRPEYDGSQDYDLMFRCIENSNSIKHIAKILYHWRIHSNSVAGDPSSKMYAYDAGKRAIEDHFKRVGIDAKVEHTGLWGMYHVIYSTKENPLVSIIIPNKDHISDLDKCIQSLYNKSAYSNFEIIVVENNSEKKETFDYYELITDKHSNLHIVKWKDKFNYSAINNFGVQYAKGDYLLFLNNDTEMINSTALAELVGCCMREDVGAVGAKLLYDDDTVQHAGVVIGFGGYAGHVNVGIGREDYGYMVRARINCNYSAVTAACMMTKKELFMKVGGFDEQFAVACNDVDYCLKLREINKLVVYNAFSEWYHYESKSRGYEDTLEKAKRFENEVEKFQKKWPEILKNGDPYYNANFAINQAPFTLGECFTFRVPSAHF